MSKIETPVLVISKSFQKVIDGEVSDPDRLGDYQVTPIREPHSRCTHIGEDEILLVINGYQGLAWALRADTDTETADKLLI
jgi:hypothetical protein